MPEIIDIVAETIGWSDDGVNVGLKRKSVMVDGFDCVPYCKPFELSR